MNRKEPHFLAALEIEMKVNRIISFCPQDSRVLIHGPTPEVAEILQARAVVKNLNIWFCSSSGERLGRSWLAIHPRAPSRTLKAELFMGLGLLINCLPNIKSNSVGRLISEYLPPSCLRNSTSDIDTQLGKAKNSNQELLEAFQVATNRALSQVCANGPSDLEPTAPKIVTPGEAARLDAEEVHGSKIVQWTGSEQLPLQLYSVDSQTHFATDRTYFFFGLTSDLAATASQRRSKGLAGSRLHMGAIMGVGYVTRKVSEIVFIAIRRAGFKWMSERGFYQCITEAIIVGRPSLSANPEIVTGLRMINLNNEEPAPWMDIPRFQHCIIKGTSSTVKSNRGTGALSTKVRLSEATSQDQILQIIKSALQISLEGAADESKLLDAGADDLGVGSLIAVDIRA
ncbi:MAG: hypothetical protein Q9213_002167 [Squamulea squamosa]